MKRKDLFKKKIDKKKNTYHMPASNCTSPPYPNANPITIFGCKTPLV